MQHKLMVFAGLILLSVQVSFAQEDYAEPEISVYDGELTEITITPQKQMSVLRRQIDNAQDQVINLFNELNDDDEYDIICKNDAPIGTRIKQKQCMPNYHRSSLQEEGLAALNAFQGSGFPGVPQSTSSVIHVKNKILREKMIALVKEDESLWGALEELNELTVEYNDRRTDYFEDE